MPVFALADLVEIVGPDVRPLQFWMENGALLALPAGKRGRGVHRLFDEKEVVIGLVLRAIVTHAHSPIGHLIQIGTALRNKLGEDRNWRDEFNKAIAGDYQLFLRFGTQLYGGELGILGNPTSEEVYTSVIKPLIKANTREESGRTLIFLTPWLSRARAPLI
jgi:hypothetical protein